MYDPVDNLISDIQRGYDVADELEARINQVIAENTPNDDCVREYVSVRKPTRQLDEDDYIQDEL